MTRGGLLWLGVQSTCDIYHLKLILQIMTEILLTGPCKINTQAKQSNRKSKEEYVIYVFIIINGTNIEVIFGRVSLLVNYIVTTINDTTIVGCTIGYRKNLVYRAIRGAGQFVHVLYYDDNMRAVLSTSL